MKSSRRNAKKDQRPGIPQYPWQINNQEDPHKEKRPENVFPSLQECQNTGRSVGSVRRQHVGRILLANRLGGYIDDRVAVGKR